ncbi:MAG TPA: hypothetical protein VE956_00925 [Nodularia sp. (in: cyanobacteria)]|nr:hypothetical protein [Nodularia sp. (in: cyanobacteria)]
MIANLSCVEEISPNQAETLSGGYRATWGKNQFDVDLTDKVKGDWTVIWVRTKPSGNKRDIFTYSASKDDDDDGPN